VSAGVAADTASDGVLPEGFDRPSVPAQGAARRADRTRER